VKVGIRIAKFEGEERWVCYASATDACYEPIFFDELSAWLYAHVVALKHSLVLEKPEYAIGEEVQKFVKLSYGDTDDFAEGDVYNDETASATSSHAWAGQRPLTYIYHPGDQILEELSVAYFEWRKDQRTTPPQRIELARKRERGERE